MNEGRLKKENSELTLLFVASVEAAGLAPHSPVVQIMLERAKSRRRK